MAESTTGTPFRSKTNRSGATILAKRFVDPDGSYQGMRLPSAAGSTVGCGVTTEDTPDGATTSVQKEGIAEVVCSAAIALDALVASGTDGRAATATTGQVARGRCVKATANAGEAAEIELWQGRSLAP
jgi:hypothetical protein